MMFGKQLKKASKSGRKIPSIHPFVLNASNQKATSGRLGLASDIERCACLSVTQLLGFGLDRRPIHIVCAPKGDFLAVITAYLPEPGEWSDDYRKRIKS
jgi:hypothetical protein